MTWGEGSEEDPMSAHDTTTISPRDRDPTATVDAQGIWCQAGLCAEAQADGVPCEEPGRRCEACERATPERALLESW